VGARFSAPVQTGPGAHPASCTMCTRSSPGVKSGRDVTLCPHPLLDPWSRKNRAIPLPPFGPYALNRASVTVQGCTLPLPLYIKNVTAPRLKFARASSVCYLYILHFLFLRRSFLSFPDISLSTKSLRATNSQSTCLSARVYLVLHQVFRSVRLQVSLARNFEHYCRLAHAPCNLVNLFNIPDEYPFSITLHPDERGRVFFETSLHNCQTEPHQIKKKITFKVFPLFLCHEIISVP